MSASAFTWIVLSCTCFGDVYGQYVKSSPTNPLVISSKSIGYLPPPPSDITAEGDNPLGTGVLLKTNEEEEDGKYHHDEDHTHWDIRKSVPGEPNKDYPVYDSVPSTSFSCEDKSEGYYADVEARCQVFHICTSMPTVKKSFLCPNGSIFNQELSICDWWTQVDCKESEQFYQRNNNDKLNQNQVETQKTLKFIPSDIDVRFGVGESTKLNVDLLPPYRMIKTKSSSSINSATDKSNPASTAQMFFTMKPDKQINLSFPPLDNRVHNPLNNRINQKYHQQEIATTFINPSSQYFGSTTPNYSTAESKTNQRGSAPNNVFKKLLYSENAQQNSEIKGYTTIHSENIQENSDVKQNIYLPPENIQENTNVKPIVNLQPENIQENSDLKQNIHHSPENIQTNSDVKQKTYPFPQNIQENSDLKQNIYLPPENIQENSDLKQNIYLPPENIQANSDVKQNIYLPPENIQANSDVKQNTYLPPENIQANSDVKQNIRVYLPPENIQANSDVKQKTYPFPQNIQENSDLKQNIYLPPENIQENSDLKQNIYLPPENIQANSDVKQNIYLPPENIQANSDIKQNTYLPPENIQENSEIKQNIYLPPENIQANSDVKQNTYLPPENIQENSYLKQNIYLPPENIQANSDVKQNIYLPPRNVQTNLEELNIDSKMITNESRIKQKLNTLPKNDPQGSIKLLKQFSSIYSNQQEDGYLNKNSDSTFSPSSFPPTLSHLLLRGSSVTPTDQTEKQLFSLGLKTNFQSSSEISSDKVIINKPIITSAVGSTKSHFISPSFSTEKYRLVNIYPVKKDEITESTPYYKSTLLVPTTQTTQFTNDGVSYVTPSSSTLVGTTSATTTESYSTTINLINDLATPREHKLTPKLTFSDNSDQKKELKISLVREYSDDETQDSEDTNLQDHSLTNTLTSTENTPTNSALRFSLFKGFSTPRPFDNNKNIGSSYLPPNLQVSSVNSINNFVTENVDLKPFDILNINNLQPSTTPLIERRNDGPELVQSISFNLDSEAGRKEFDLAVSSGLFSNS